MEYQFGASSAKAATFDTVEIHNPHRPGATQARKGYGSAPSARCNGGTTSERRKHGPNAGINVRPTLNKVKKEHAVVEKQAKTRTSAAALATGRNAASPKAKTAPAKSRQPRASKAKYATNVEPRQEPQPVLPMLDHSLLFEISAAEATALIDSSAVADSGTPHEEPTAPIAAVIIRPRPGLKLVEEHSTADKLQTAQPSHDISPAAEEAAHKGTQAARFKAAATPSFSSRVQGLEPTAMSVGMHKVAEPSIRQTISNRTISPEEMEDQTNDMRQAIALPRDDARVRPRPLSRPPLINIPTLGSAERNAAQSHDRLTPRLVSSIGEAGYIRSRCWPWLAMVHAG